MDLDEPLTDTSDTSAPAPPVPTPRLRPPRFAPFGGTKWALMFAGTRESGIAVPSVHTRAAYLDSTGTLMTAERDPAAGTDPTGPADAFWLQGGGSVPLGTLLSDRLPAWLVAAQQATDLPLTGPALSEAETGLLTALQIADRHLPPGAAHRFETLLVPDAIADHLAPAGAAALALMRRLRPPVAPGAPATVAILPAAGPRFTLRNRATVAAWLRARRATLLAPDVTPFTTTADALGAATLVIIAEPAQAGLLALCQPGTRIVEIAAEGWAGARTRTLCAALDLRWRLFLGGPPTYPLNAPLPFGAPTPMAYEISIARLNKALSQL
jgi:hypothetical protein